MLDIEDIRESIAKARRYRATVESEGISHLNILDYIVVGFEFNILFNKNKMPEDLYHRVKLVRQRENELDVKAIEAIYPDLDSLLEQDESGKLKKDSSLLSNATQQGLLDLPTLKVLNGKLREYIATQEGRDEEKAAILKIHDDYITFLEGCI
jgi:hypothetical protein